MSTLTGSYYNISAVTNSIFANHTYKNFLMTNEFVQLLYGDQTSSASLTGAKYFDNKFLVNYDISSSALYNSVGFSLLRHVNTNGWNDVAIQQNIGIWKTPSPTSSDKQIATRFQELGISNYYFTDEVANGTVRFYYLPATASVTGTMTGLLTQNVIRFIDINKDMFGPSLALTSGTGLLQNLSGTTTALTVEMYFRPIPQDGPGFIWQRLTSFSGQVVDSYRLAGSGTLTASQFYSGAPYYGIGCYTNGLKPVTNADAERPYIDFYAYGALSGTDEHYLNLTTGLVNEAAHTRFELSDAVLRTLFDGNFHNLRCTWSVADYYSQGRLYLDGSEILATTQLGTGRKSALSYTLNSSVCATPFYFMSQHDNTRNMGVQQSSKRTTYGEVKQILVFNTALSGSPYATSSITANTQLLTTIGSQSGSVCSWLAGNNVTNTQFSVVDLTQSVGIRNVSLTADIVNDNATSIPEGSVDRVFGLIHDRVGEFIQSEFDGMSGNAVYQTSVGKLYNNEYDRTQDDYIGLFFYNKGIGLLLNDGYNSVYGQSTQQFVSSPTGSFTLNQSDSLWQLYYTSFASRHYVSRKVLSITADANHFAKSSNPSSVFKVGNSDYYTKSNKKFITGIVWYNRNQQMLAMTKFSEPIFKQENESLAFDIVLDL